MSIPKKIFISHASEDKILADAFVDLLVLGLNINTSDFFCTSLEGLGIPSGENFIEFIQRQIEGCRIVIPLLSPNYYESRFCLCELGASWILSRALYPILVPPLQISDVDDILLKKQIKMIDKGDHLDDLRDDLTKKLSLNGIRSSRWGTKKDRFLLKLPKILMTLPEPKSVSYEQHEELKVKYDDLLQQMESMEYQIIEQKDLINDLKSCKDQDQVREVVKEYSTLEERFENLVGKASKAVEQLPYIVKEALYYHFRGEKMPIDERYDDIKLQMEYELLTGYLGDIYEAGYAEVSKDNPKIKKAISALSELGKFIYKVTNEDEEDYEDKYEDFVENFCEEQGFKLSFISRSFWETFL